MSDQSAKAFVIAASVNPELMAKVDAAIAGSSRADAGTAVTALGAAEGFGFSAVEIVAAREAFLEEEMLSNVRGGSGFWAGSNPTVDDTQDGGAFGSGSGGISLGDVLSSQGTAPITATQYDSSEMEKQYGEAGGYTGW